VPENPVIVRVGESMSESELVALAQSLNESSAASYSNTERANVDAQKIGGVLRYEYYLSGLTIGNTDYTVKAVVAVSDDGIDITTTG